jgi:DNA replication protein DnaC
MLGYNKLLNNLETLKMDKIRNFLPAYLESVTAKDISFVDALLELTDKELDFRNERASKIQVAVSAFPFEKGLDDFDFDFQPSINKKQILDLATLRFLENRENILFYGNPGVGKSHLAVSLGILAAKSRYITYFISCHELITQLNKAHLENRLDAKLKHFSKYRLLIIDEVGYLPIDKQGANLLFQLVARRYEKNSTIITTNQAFSKWAEVFSDAVIANALLDRLVHHSHIIKIIGPSYRMKDKLERMESNDLAGKK